MGSAAAIFLASTKTAKSSTICKKLSGWWTHVSYAVYCYSKKRCNSGNFPVEHHLTFVTDSVSKTDLEIPVTHKTVTKSKNFTAHTPRQQSITILNTHAMKFSAFFKLIKTASRCLLSNASRINILRVTSWSTVKYSSQKPAWYGENFSKNHTRRRFTMRSRILKRQWLKNQMVTW